MMDNTRDAYYTRIKSDEEIDMIPYYSRNNTNQIYIYMFSNYIPNYI